MTARNRNCLCGWSDVSLLISLSLVCADRAYQLFISDNAQ
ncbi:hypothetical protein HMPREF1318_0171 [Actinomyces massiliensis F0489]|uniref:Uncharacterized protein n=1 Tax=Actinomyces massiliensis F0489 TaxID=1125718 RepID=J0NNJ5_9ACTO|nr:hypothetical protein HMPREF1318_0171 [Actinomyces massiliensis F0489]